MSRSLDRRRDNRSIEQFKQDIKAATVREQILMELFAEQMQRRGIQFDYEDYGIDNSGEFTEYSDARPDFMVWYQGKQELWEVKANPWSHKQTFKVHDLKEYVRHNARILLFYGIGHDKTSIDQETTRWALIDTTEISAMLKDKPHQRGDAKWGGKQVVVIYPKEYATYFVENKLL